jgi:hypothetical protein
MKTKIIYREEVKPVVKLEDIPKGQLFIANVGISERGLFVRIDDHFYPIFENASNGHYWNLEASLENYKPVRSLEVTV